MARQQAAPPFVSVGSGNPCGMDPSHMPRRSRKLVSAAAIKEHRAAIGIKASTVGDCLVSGTGTCTANCCAKRLQPTQGPVSLWSEFWLSDV